MVGRGECRMVRKGECMNVLRGECRFVGRRGGGAGVEN